MAQAHAQQGTAPAYPVKPVRVIVSASTGGLTDIQARLFSQKLVETFGQTFVVDNRPGAGGLIGFMTVAGAAPDGYTLLAASPSLTTVQALQEKAGYDPVRDFAPISLMIRAAYLLVAHPSFPAKSMTEFLAFARAKPGALNFALGGIGSIQHLGAAWIMTSTGVKMTLIPYKGLGPALTDLMAGQIHATIANPTNVAPLVRSGKLRAVATTGANRSAVFPDVGTVAEAGIPDYDLISWQGWLAPRGTPAPLIGRLNAALVKAVQSPEISGRLKADGGEPVGGSAEAFGKLIAAESTRWRKLVAATGMRAVQ